MSELVALGGHGVPARSSRSARLGGHRPGLRVHRRPRGRRARARRSAGRCRRGSGRTCSVASSTGCCARWSAPPTWLEPDARGQARGRSPRSPWEPAVRSARRSSPGDRGWGPCPVPVAAGAPRPRAARACRAPWSGSRPAGAGRSPTPLVTVGRWTPVRSPVEDWPVRRPAAGPRAAGARPSRCSPASGCSTRSSRWPAAAPSRCPAASARARRCCCSRSRSGAPPTSSSTSAAASAATRWPTSSAELAELTDPRTGRPLAERTVIIANTSNMPMMAREASIYSGVTVAEYFRDMGYDVVRHRRLDVAVGRGAARVRVALRRAARRGGLPGRAAVGARGLLRARRPGRRPSAGDAASVTIIGAVSPPGGDTTEPVTAHTERFVRAVWSLDRDLAYARHYPAVAWSGVVLPRRRRGRRSGTPATATRTGRRRRARVVGAARRGRPARRPGRARRRRRRCRAHERVALLAGRLLREGVLQQSALSANDAYCSAAKTAALVDAVLGGRRRVRGPGRRRA